MSNGQKPLLAGFHPDPSVCRASDAFYLVTSTFEYLPGAPIYRSEDLRDWQLAGHALERTGVPDALPSEGMYAGTLRWHADRFWMITTNVSEHCGHLLVHAADPRGPWSEPVRFASLDGIDPDLAWDDDGVCYLTYAGYRDERPAGIMQAIVDPRSGEILREPALSWEGTGGSYPEAPHLYRIADRWYLLIAEGGTERGHMVTIARGRSPTGPFEAFPGNPILTRRSTTSLVQSTGHGDLVQRADGSWAMVFLGTRPRGGNAGYAPLGREVFAREVTWLDGWPRVGAPIEPRSPAPIIEDVPGAIPPTWMSPGHHPADLIQRRRDGWRLAARDGEVVFVGRRQQHPWIRVRADLDARAGVGGVSLRIDPRHHYDLHLAGSRVRAIACIGGLRNVLAEGAAMASSLWLRTEPARATREQPWPGPDTIVLGYTTDDADDIELARVDGRYLTSDVAGGFTGRVVGFYASAGHVVLRRWHYEGIDDDRGYDARADAR